VRERSNAPLAVVKIASIFPKLSQDAELIQAGLEVIVAGPSPGASL
jgi:hypothetical protein